MNTHNSTHNMEPKNIMSFSHQNIVERPFTEVAV